MLKSVKSVIVDELHAVAGSKRGAHLMLRSSGWRRCASEPPVRIGLSATREAARRDGALPGRRSATSEVAIIDAGHVRERDLAIEVPRSPLDRGDGRPRCGTRCTTGSPS